LYIIRPPKGRFHPFVRPKRRMSANTALGHGLFRSGRLKAGATSSGGLL
jgi:hypothetical protein